MNFEEFKKNLSDPTPAPDFSAYLQSLWYDAKGDWNKAHEIIQDIEDKTAAWIHAYLHRKEGDTELTHPVIASLDHPLSGEPERG